MRLSSELKHKLKGQYNNAFKKILGHFPAINRNSNLSDRNISRNLKVNLQVNYNKFLKIIYSASISARGSKSSCATGCLLPWSLDTDTIYFKLWHSINFQILPFSHCRPIYRQILIKLF